MKINVETSTVFGNVTNKVLYAETVLKEIHDDIARNDYDDLRQSKEVKV